MICRRTFILTGVAGLLAGAATRRVRAAQPWPDEIRKKQMTEGRSK